MTFEDAMAVFELAKSINEQLEALEAVLKEAGQKKSAKTAAGLVVKVNQVGGVTFARGMLTGVKRAEQLGLFTKKELEAACKKGLAEERKEAAAA